MLKIVRSQIYPTTSNLLLLLVVDMENFPVQTGSIYVRLTLAEIEVQNAKACVLLNFACIYKFEHTDRETGAELTQIAVGIEPNQRLKTGLILFIRTCTLTYPSICVTGPKLGRKSRSGHSSTKISYAFF